MKLWGGRFEEDIDQHVLDFTSSISYDRRLALYDIEGSRVHTRMLVKQSLISEDEGEAILQGLEEIRREIEEGNFTFQEDLEDIHLTIETSLIERIGAVGGKLHTGRSRNDQVNLDMRLFLRHESREIANLLLNLLSTLVTKSQENIEVILPGYTHLQRAQPVRLSHHFLAYYEMFKRDLERLHDSRKRIEIMPLGSAALAASPLPLDREWVAEELGFKEISKNSMDVVSDRDFILEFLSFAAITGQHMSRLAEDLILWSSKEFSFIEIHDSFCTGSSIMPQKKNPDVLELLRGKTGRLYGNLFTLLTVMKGLPLTYNRDLQEDKEALFDTVDTLKPLLLLAASLLQRIEVKREKMREACNEGFLQATDVADYLVRKGLPFREAHTLVGRIVLYALKEKKDLLDLTLNEWKEFSSLFTSDIEELLDLEKSVDRRDLIGGPAQTQNQRHIEEALEEIERLKKDSLSFTGR